MIKQAAARAASSSLDILERRIKEPESENTRLRQQRDAANAQIDYLLEEMENDYHEE